MVAVDVAGGTTPALGTPVKLFSRHPLGVGGFGWVPNFGVNGDGTRFVTVRGSDTKGSVPSVTLVQNWYAEHAKRR